MVNTDGLVTFEFGGSTIEVNSNLYHRYDVMQKDSGSWQVSVFPDTEGKPASPIFTGTVSTEGEANALGTAILAAIEQAISDH
jgi:hypothetical protein